MFFKVVVLKDTTVVFSQWLTDGNFCSICLLKGIVPKRTLLCFPIFSRASELMKFLIGSKFHISFLSILWKVNYLNQKTFTGALLCNTEGPCKVWSKIELCFPNKPPKKCSIYFERAKRVQISNFLAFFCLKSKLPEPKTFRGVLFGDAKDPSKVCAKIGLCFPNKPKKNWLICFQRAKRVQILDFIAFFFVWRVNGLNQFLIYFLKLPGRFLGNFVPLSLECHDK